MAVTSSEPAPYAPAKAVLELVNRFRNRGLPTPISGEVLGRSGISDSLIPRTLQALKSLDLIDEDGKPTPTFEGLRLAPAADFKTRMSEWLNDAYSDVLRFVDPATADETSIRDAFRNYRPVGQQDRMVLLFVGLYAAAGIIAEKAKNTRGPSRPKTPSAKSTAINGNGFRGDLNDKKVKTEDVNSGPIQSPPKAMFALIFWKI